MEEKSKQSVSILIPTYNAGKIWIDVINSIDSQDYVNLRKIIIDSGSKDDTLKIAIDHGYEIIEIPQSSFNHGKTRQQLVDLSSDADICVFLTQDAILASPNSIDNIVKVFNDPEIGMAYGRQLPHKNAKLLESHARFYNYPAQSHVRSYAQKKQMGFKVFFCSNSFAAYRRSALLAVGGFPSDSIMGEDAIVAAKILAAGFKKAYVADATAHHSHSYTLAEEFKRYFDTRVFHEQNKWLIDTYGRPTGEGIKFMKSELAHVIKNDWTLIFKSISSLGAKWLGYKGGGFYKMLPTSILKKVSMHKHYWR